MDIVVLAFSGGLDTTVCVKLLEEKYNYEVIIFFRGCNATSTFMEIKFYAE